MTASTETTESPVESAPAAAGRRGTFADRMAALLVGLATVLAVVGVFSTWVRVEALDTDAWVALGDDLLAEPEVQSALATYLVDELYRQLDVAAEVEAALPENLAGLSPLLAASLRGPATNGAERLLASDQFRSAWEAVNRAAHQTLVNVLRDETRPGISTADGAVTLELGELVRVVGADLGLSGDRLDRLPADAGEVILFESDELDTVQSAVRLLDFLSWFTFVLVVALYAVAVYIARGRRRVVLRNVGLSLVAAGLFVAIVRAVGVRAIVDAIVSDPTDRAWATVVADVSTGFVRQMAWSAILYGVVITLFAILLGDHRWATFARRVVAPALNSSNGAVAAGTAVAIAVLLWWSPGRAFEQWTTGLALILLVIGAIVALARSTRREFPSTTFDDAIASVRGQDLNSVATRGRFGP